ncbi:thymidylate kinase [Jannaschia pagri]|uniref:Thymidylate kinase n=1 Tax=Jannaschia pagri TaxID=2829797 RepID=A0ABQ4NMT1_9RHOB|nr:MULTISPECIES: dTMP kinase [unclassified Jannaschia]GIT91873.1 thymidylate kinase [Jannaschia sp. AI_61]GIT95707.1 thymidylate kinase [Jannaschia sp. AI_62]
MFISFEGIDGCGKSTQARLLADHLVATGQTVLRSREPGGSAGAEAIRSLLVEGDPGRWSPVTELLLYNAARRDNLERRLLPALARGDWVVSDRWTDSTRVYQATRGGERHVVDALQDLVIGREPDLTFVIDMDPDQALRRGLARDHDEDRFEQLGLEFQRLVRSGYLGLAKDYPDRIRVIDGAAEPDVVAARVRAHLP